MNNVRKALTVLVAGAALAVVPLTPSMASAAPTDPEIASGCDFALVSIKARNLRHDGATDFVFVKLDRTFFPAGGDGIPFKLGDKRPASDFGNPTMGFGPAGLNVALVTDDFPINHAIAGTIPCAAATNEVTTFSDGDATYDMVYDVTT